MGRKELLAVLDRASRDLSYSSLLAKNLAVAIQEHDLTEQERAAFATADVLWIENHLTCRCVGLDCGAWCNTDRDLP